MRWSRRLVWGVSLAVLAACATLSASPLATPNAAQVQTWETLTAQVAQTLYAGATQAARSLDCPKTCGAMRSCEQAKACLRAGHKRLDRDNDGIPCETLCKGG